MNCLTTLGRRLCSSSDGQDLIEYALLAALIALVVVSGVTALGSVLNQWYGSISGQVPGAGS